MTSASIDQRALGLSSAFQSFALIAPVIIWFNAQISANMNSVTGQDERDTANI